MQKITPSHNVKTLSRRTKRKRLPPGVPNPVDIHVGDRVRRRRVLLGLSQEKLGDAVGLTFQQIQKYERGANRISASRLFQFCHILDVPISFFFDEMPTGLRAGNGGHPVQRRLCQDTACGYLSGAKKGRPWQICQQRKG